MNETQTQNYKRKTKINYSVSVKGVVTPDITLECLDVPSVQVLIEATELLDRALLEARSRTTPQKVKGDD